MSAAEPERAGSQGAEPARDAALASAVPAAAGQDPRDLEKWALLRPALLLYAAAVSFSMVFVGVAVLSERWEPLLALFFFAASFVLTLRGHRRRLRAIRERDPSVTKGYGILAVAWVLLIAGIYLPFTLMQALES